MERERNMILQRLKHLKLEGVNAWGNFDRMPYTTSPADGEDRELAVRQS